MLHFETDLELVFKGMCTLNLEDPNCLPVALRGELRDCNAIFAQSTYLGEIERDERVARVIERINDYCACNNIFAYHYTRALRSDLTANGLVPRSGDEIRQTFLCRFGSRFSVTQLREINAAWSSYHHGAMVQARDSRIFFNFTRKALGGAGSELLLKYFGGEQVYFCIRHIPGVAEVLSSIGEPLVVRCTLAPAELHTFIPKPWGRIVISSYHRTVNPEAGQFDQDGYQSSPVPPERIEFLSVDH